MENDTFFTVQEAAQKLGVHETAIRNATLQDRLPFVHRYGRKLIAASELEAYRLRSQPNGVKRTGRPKATDRKTAPAAVGKGNETE